MRPQLNPVPRLQTFVRNHKILAPFLLLFFAIIATYAAWCISAATRGKIAAHLDLRRGQYSLLLVGLPPQGEPTYLRILKDRYGIHAKHVAYCIVSQPVRDYATSYDEVVAAALRRKFHRDVLQDTAREVFAPSNSPK